MSPESEKPIRLSAHAQSYFISRGFSEAEVVDAIRTASWEMARGGRFEVAKDYPHNDEWNGSYYATKRVRPVFVEEPDEIVVVTVYTYYF